MKRQYFNRCVFLFLAFLLLIFGQLGAQPINLLFGPAPENKPGTLNLRLGPEVVDTQNIVLNPRFFSNDIFSVPAQLFGVEINITRNVNKLNPNDQFQWWGLVEGDRASYVLFSRSGNIYAGDILWKNVLYQIRSIGNDLYQLRKINQTGFPKDDSTYIQKEIKLAPNSFTTTCTNTDAPIIIDLMVLYSDDVLAAAGSVDVVEVEIKQAVHVTNLIYYNSGVIQRVDLVNVDVIDFSESKISTTDLTTLKGNPNVLASRNAHSADIVALMVDSLDFCGQADILTSTVDAAELYAYCVVKQSCAISYYSLAHELGHLMGGKHDCCDSPASLPIDDAHGFGYLDHDIFVGTVMSCVTCSGMDSLRRIPYFSNPGIVVDFVKIGSFSPTYNPLEVPGTDPFVCDYLGMNFPKCYANNSRVINFTAQTVSNFRCHSSKTANVWMKDSWSDNGAEPDTAKNIWNSPAIWVRNKQDNELMYRHQHENPQLGATNWVYVKLHNGGPTVTDTLKLYYTDASFTSPSWPKSWTLLAEIPVQINANSSKIVEYKWAVPFTPMDYTLLARWVSKRDPMHLPETGDIGTNVNNNNNIVIKNLKVLDLAGVIEKEVAMVIDARQGTSFEINFENTFPNKSFLDYGKVEIYFKRNNFLVKRSNTIQGSGIRTIAPDVFLVSSPKVTFENIAKNQKIKGTLTLRFVRTQTTPKQDYYCSVKQLVPASIAITKRKNTLIGKDIVLNLD